MSYSSKAARRRNRGKACPYCGQPMRDGRSHPSPDHLWPRSKGGMLLDGNLVWCCWQCNQDKRAIPLVDWLEKLKRAGDRRSAYVERFMEELPTKIHLDWARKFMGFRCEGDPTP